MLVGGVRFVHALGHALAVAGGMTWQILWSLILGFALSSVVQALVRRGTVERLLGNDSPKTLGLATGLAPEEAFARGIAAGSAAVMRYGTAHPQRADVEELYRQMMGNDQQRGPA